MKKMKEELMLIVENIKNYKGFQREVIRSMKAELKTDNEKLIGFYHKLFYGEIEKYKQQMAMN